MFKKRVQTNSHHNTETVKNILESLQIPWFYVVNWNFGYILCKSVELGLAQLVAPFYAYKLGTRIVMQAVLK